ncbi:hypothetical protein QA601_09235 [Chitinispirillales bacterium ANBcel5]|uniref:hypothetical protein n=1 Tax=Cellulosispirillum alkaliphilum TaxID=3039283 RepID=UPI002A523401|nr:hypothetical protein [Chitinispirillales bacterium ANBcel5]
MKKEVLLFSFMVVVCCTGFAQSYNPHIRMNPSIERFLYRMQTRYGFDPGDIGTQPLSVQRVLETLDSLEHNVSLTSRERFDLQRLRKSIGAERGIYAYTHDDGELNLNAGLNLIGDMDGSLNSDAAGGRGIINPYFTGNIGALSFFAEIDVWTEYRSDTLFNPSSYQPYDGVPYNLYGRNTEESNLRSSDLPRGGISYSQGRIDLGLSIDYLKWGPALHYPVTLSGQTPPVTAFRADLDLEILQYQHLAGLLQSQRDKRKYIYAHRLSGRWRNVQFGINEVIIGGSTTDRQPPEDPHNSLRHEYYGEERTLEIVYLIPFVPKVFIEHYIGDRDNAAISLDLNITLPANLRLYGEFHIDDILSPWEIFSDDWGNKWALTWGLNWEGELYERDVSAGFEYSRVEPWVYTHFYGGSHRFTNFGQPLGNQLGPNSRAVLAWADMAISHRNRVGIRINSEERNPSARGGSVEHVFQDEYPRRGTPDSETKQFLGPGTVHHLRPGIYWQFDQFGPFRVDALYELDVMEDRGRSTLHLYGGFYF